MLRLFGAYKNWASIPKFFNMRKYTEDIRRYGMTDLTTTGPKESYVKRLRAMYQFSNRKDESIQQQVRHIIAILHKPLIHSFDICAI